MRTSLKALLAVGRPPSRVLVALAWLACGAPTHGAVVTGPRWRGP